MRTELPMETYCYMHRRPRTSENKWWQLKLKWSPETPVPRSIVWDKVVVMQKKKNKLTSVFNPTPPTVKNIKSSMNTASKNKWSIIRDATKFRKLYGGARQNSKVNEEEIHEAESDTSERLHHDGDNIEQNNAESSWGWNVKDSYQLGSETMRHRIVEIVTCWCCVVVYLLNGTY